MGTIERRAREKDAKRRAILRAAIRSFDRKGYDATTLEDVARLAEVAKGTVYLYFKSKADLFASLLLEHGFDVFALRLEESLAPCRDLPAALEAFTRTFRELCLEGRREIFEFFVQLDRGDILRDLSPELREEARRRLEPILERLAGFFPEKRDGRKSALVLWALCIGVAHLARGGSLAHLRIGAADILREGTSRFVRSLR